MKPTRNVKVKIHTFSFLKQKDPLPYSIALWNLGSLRICFLL